MKRDTHKWAALSAALVVLLLASAAPGAWAQDRDKKEVEFDEERSRPKVVPLEDARLKIEKNSTDQDIGAQVFIDHISFEQFAALPYSNGFTFP